MDDCEGFIDETKLKKHRYVGIAQAKRFDYNPFFESYKITLDKRRLRKIGVERAEYVNPDTGLISLAHIDIYDCMIVDNEKFVKVFIRHMDDILNLSATGKKMFAFLLTVLEKDTDKFRLDISDCLKFTKWKGKKSIYIALVELINEGVIAKAEFELEYYINPAMFINGDRFRVLQEYHKAIGNPKLQRKFIQKDMKPY